MGREVRKCIGNADEVFARVREACSRLGFRTSKEDAVTRSLQVDTDVSPLSWGETIHIIVSQHQDGSTISLESGPKVWFNLPAKERAARNVRHLLEELAKG
jgi:hypothetical protein